MQISIPKQIFKEYDIRARLGKELNPDIAYHLARLFAVEIGSGYVVTGKDARSSSKELLDSFTKGLLDSGVNVLELEGISTSPLLYFAQRYLKSNAAIMITGSHNPLEYNGLKFMLNQQPFYGADLKNIIHNKVVDGKGEHKIIDLRDEYIKALMSNFNSSNDLNIVWDCNNSGVAIILDKIAKIIGGKHLLLHTSLDGNFAHSQPDPLIEANLDEIKQHVANYKLGIAFDGDADRLVVVRADASVLTTDQLIYLLALSLKDQSNKNIILDVKASDILVKALEDEGFKVYFSLGGHSIMKKEIIQRNAILAGEASGHFIINDGNYYPFDDALYIALRLIRYWQNKDLKFLPLANITKEIRIDFDNGDREKIIQEILLGELYIRQSYHEGWWLIRPSNTEDYLLIKYEAMNQAQAEIIVNDISKILKKSILPLQI